MGFSLTPVTVQIGNVTRSTCSRDVSEKRWAAEHPLSVISVTHKCTRKHTQSVLSRWWNVVSPWLLVGFELIIYWGTYTFTHSYTHMKPICTATLIDRVGVQHFMCSGWFCCDHCEKCHSFKFQRALKIHFHITISSTLQRVIWKHEQQNILFLVLPLDSSSQR